ncbi:MAG: Gfo/Idh/MocA family oxidoreductase [Magnetospirillum sp.]|nr:Gfo/Idh/MocA family oxidoreductase [Magnetospirillum sp.]
MTHAKLRLAMIGGAAPSMIGPVHRIAALMDGRFEIVAGVPSSDPAKGRIAGAEWGLAAAHIHPDIGALLAAEAGRLDAVAICTPNDSHYAYVKAALEAGLHAIVDKPLCNDAAQGQELAELARARGSVLALTHAYAGYPMVRDARTRVARGEIGELRMVLVEYLGAGLARKVEEDTGAARRWRLDRARSGPSLVLGDIGTHAHHLACFVAGRRMVEISAEVGALMPGRAVHDYAQIRFRMEGGARGAMTVCQGAAGAENDILVRVYGSLGHVEWRHADHNHLKLAFLDGETRIYGRGQPNVTPEAARATRIARGGHPEGLHEAFANLYSDFAAAIEATRKGTSAASASPDLPMGDDGADGLRFVAAALSSSSRQGQLVAIRSG